MLHQATYWVNIAGSAVDALLLGRILQLKLQRTYVFITLACLLILLFDGIGIWLWSDVEAWTRVFIYSRFLYAFVYPLVGWDVLEEMAPQISKLRSMAVRRLISGMIFSTALGSIVALLLSPTDNNSQPVLLDMLAIVVWAGATAATLGFLWTLRRTLRSQNVVRPSNTSVWMMFWLLLLLAEIVDCFATLLPMLRGAPSDILGMILLVYGMVITGWCIMKLRAIPSDVPSAPESAKL